MKPEEIKPVIDQLLPGVSLTVEGATLVVRAEDLVSVCRCLKEHERCAFDYLSNLTAVDFPADAAVGGAGRIDMVYYLYSIAKGHGPVILNVALPRDRATVASVTPIWRGAEFQEREVFDLFGVTFEGHPDLRRILMWDGFKGHPMRKDYKVEDKDALVPPPAASAPPRPPAGGGFPDAAERSA